MPTRNCRHNTEDDHELQRFMDGLGWVAYTPCAIGLKRCPGCLLGTELFKNSHSGLNARCDFDL